MKSPWKLLVQLTTGRRKEASGSSSIEHDSRSEAIDGQELDALAPPLGREAIDAKAENVQRNSNEQAAAPAANTDDGSGAGQAVSPESDIADTQVTILEDAGSSSGVEATLSRVDAALGSGSEIHPPSESASLKKPQARAKRARAVPIAKGEGGAKQDEPQRPSSVNPFFDEVGELDDEIKQLKGTLAGKLRLQNAQLKKLLKRFDAA